MSEASVGKPILTETIKSLRKEKSRKKGKTNGTVQKNRSTNE